MLFTQFYCHALNHDSVQRQVVPHRTNKSALGSLLCGLRLVCMMGLFVLVGFSQHATAQEDESKYRSRELTLQSQYWVDTDGKATIEELSTRSPTPFKPLATHRKFALDPGAALWLRLDLPARPENSIDFLHLSSGAHVDRASLFQQNAAGQWSEQRAGDRLAVAQWDYPDQSPVFKIASHTANTVWLRLENTPPAIAPRVHLSSETQLVSQRRWSYLLMGSYVGFSLLVLFLGMMHAWLYRDRAFTAYSTYVVCMTMFQLTYTGIGGLFFWPHWAWFNNAAQPIFALLLVSSGIWFAREVLPYRRYSRWLDTATMAWAGAGVLLSIFYTVNATKTASLLLNLYALLSVLASITIYLWIWWRGERYGWWMFLGFLPIHLAYPFPALRSAGFIADNWLSQYAVVLAAAVEIPLLLYMLHRRAKDLGDNTARMRAIDHTDPLTGLPIEPVLKLRLRDALKRDLGSDQQRSLLLVDLANHAEIAEREGHTAGDRALVVTASCLLATRSELDTICRIDSARFAILVEQHINPQQRSTLAQTIVARGLAQFAESNEALPLRLRVVTAQLNPGNLVAAEGQPIELDDALRPLVEEMNELALESRRSIVHLSTQQTGVLKPQVSGT